MSVFVVVRRDRESSLDGPVAVYATRESAYADLDVRTGRGERPDLDHIYHVEEYDLRGEAADRMSPHFPRVRIVTPKPERGLTENVLTKIEVDGAMWAITDYAVEGRKVEGIQKLTLTFIADVTIEHPEEPTDAG